MSTIRCDIVSAEQEIFHGEATLVVATGELGELGIAPKHAPLVYALDNLDPFAQASVLSRGLIGEHGGELWVASPLKKQHFRLSDGHCLENADFSVRAYPVRIDGDLVAIGL